MGSSEKNNEDKLVGDKETAVFLRLIDAANVHHLLPYGHLLYGRFDEEGITLDYAMHEVSIRGRSLHGTFTNIQAMRLCQLGFGNDNGVTEILVRDRNEAWREPETAEPGEN